MSNFFISNYAIDLSKQALTVSDAYDSQAILQSIENILLTVPGERVFEPEFGSRLMTTIFKNINQQSGERLLDSLIAAINRWEPRVSVVSKECKLFINPRENSLSIYISFIINKSFAKAAYTKKLSF